MVDPARLPVAPGMTPRATPRPTSSRGGGVQSIARAFDLLEVMADAGGVVGLSDLATSSGLPMPTIHRLLRTLVDLGYVRQEPSRAYALGPRLIRLGDSANRLVSTWATPYLRRLVDSLGESANLAMLDGGQIVYIAQSPGRHSMRMFTEVGRRVDAHCTAVGKAILAELPLQVARSAVATGGMAQHTEHTLTDWETFAAHLEQIRSRGYATDEQEQEIGVRCVAVVLPGAPVRAGLSISGPVTRMTDQLVSSAVPLLREAAAQLSAELDLVGPGSRRSG